LISNRQKSLLIIFLNYLGKGKSGFEIRARQASRLDGYEIGLRATAEHYDIDAQNFSKIVARIKYSSNYRCYGTNDNP